MNVDYLNQMFPTKIKRINFMAKCALAFGIRLDVLSELLHTDKDELYKEMMLYNNNISASLNMLFNHGMISQEEAKRNFLTFFNALCLAAKNRDNEKAKILFEQIGDRKAIELKNKERKPGDRLTDEEIVIILKYQLKYLVDTENIARVFNINRMSYCKRVRALGQNNARLISDFDYLSDYYHNVSFMKARRAGY